MFDWLKGKRASSKISYYSSYRKKRSPVFSFGLVLLEALLLAMLFRSLFFDNFHVPSGSMKPTLLVGDKLTISKFAYGYSRYSFPFGIVPFKGRFFDSSQAKQPKRGDIVVFKLPSNHRINYVKRLIGLPGDTIQMVNGVLYINKVAVVQTKLDDFIDRDQNDSTVAVPQYIEEIEDGSGGKLQYKVLDYYDGSFADNTEEFTVPPEHYFFMGDNRDNSQDSRFDELGFVHKDLLLGKVKLILISSPNSLLNPMAIGKIRFSRIFASPN